MAHGLQLSPTEVSTAQLRVPHYSIRIIHSPRQFQHGCPVSFLGLKYHREWKAGVAPLPCQYDPGPLDLATRHYISNRIQARTSSVLY